MNILYCGDRNIQQGLTLSILSLLEHAPEPLHIYVLTASLRWGDKSCQALPDSCIQELDSLLRTADARNSIVKFDISGLVRSEPPTVNLNTRFTPCCMLRLYADRVAQIPDRILYLDTDVLCRGDLTEFYYQDLEGAELAGVLDYYGRWFFRRNILRMDYLNSGVLLLDLGKIRQTGLFRRCVRRCAEKKMFMPDQSAINKLAQKKKILPRKYNEQRLLQPDTVLQHFSTSLRFFPVFHTVSVKPWDIQRMHSVLKLHEYDSLLEKFQTMKGSNPQ